jgi:hypothetical protein
MVLQWEQSLVPAHAAHEDLRLRRPMFFWAHSEADTIKPPCRHRWLGVIDVILMMAVPILCVVTNNLLPIITVKQTPKNITSHRFLPTSTRYDKLHHHECFSRPFHLLRKGLLC